MSSILQFKSNRKYHFSSRKILLTILGNKTMNFLYIFKVDFRLHTLANTCCFLPYRSPVLVINQCGQERSKCQGYRIPLNSFYGEGEGCGAESHFVFREESSISQQRPCPTLLPVREHPTHGETEGEPQRPVRAGRGSLPAGRV